MVAHPKEGDHEVLSNKRTIFLSPVMSKEQLSYEQFVVVPKPINLIQDYLNFGFMFSTFW